MKRFLFVISAVILTTITATAQRISVVTESGATSVHRTLQQAIKEAAPGSTIYLPGGGFSIADSVKITKRLTIIGIGHKSLNENADGSTIISGNLWFNEGSSGSAIMSCYITGNVNIGDGGAEVNDVTIKYCNLNSVDVKNSTCQETIVNQNYIRNTSSFGESNGRITNNIMHSAKTINNGVVSNNIIISVAATNYVYRTYYNALGAKNSIISNNIILSKGDHYTDGDGYIYPMSGNNCQKYHNMMREEWGDDCVNIGNVNWNDVFVFYNGGAINPISDFHFKEEYVQYEDEVGIYSGDGFNKDQLAPVPYIVSKSIPEQTDAAGRLNIKIRVKAGD